jgi:hypothetical protein
MRPRRSSHILALASVLASAAAGVSEARAQAGGQRAEEGALFLLLPVGARSVGIGQATVAQRGSSEAVWWNPAGLAASEKREAAIHHSQSIIGTGDAVTVVIPSSLLGVLAASVNIVSFGEQEPRPDEQATVGTLVPRSFVYAATYATAIGSWFGAGITYKVLQLRVDCSASCPNVSTFSATSSALDFGAQYAPKKIPIVVGVGVRNVGIRLQVNDNPQSDPLPTRLQIGVQYRFTVPEQYAKDTRITIETDVIDKLSFSQPAPRIGAELAWKDRAYFRTGYVFQSDQAGGPSIGLGVSYGKFVLDIARILAGLSVDAGQAPTFLSLRYLF